MSKKHLFRSVSSGSLFPEFSLMQYLLHHQTRVYVCAGLQFYSLTAVSVKAPSVTSISDEERAAGGILCQPENQRLRTLYGYCLVTGKGHKGFQVWNEMIREDMGGFKCQLEENTRAHAFFPTSFALMHYWSCLFFPSRG